MDNRNPLLVKKDVPLSIPEIDELLHSLNKKEKREMHIKESLPNKLKSNIQEITEKIDGASKQMEDIFQNVGKGKSVPIAEIKEDILPAIKLAAETPHLYHLFYELNSKDEYTYKHTICVGIIATMIGKWLKLKTDELANLTLGATLHDIGKSRISKDILNKPGKLTKEEYEEMKMHTVIGFDLLMEIPDLDERVAIIALQHHEREDGVGYPLGLKGSQIDPLAKVVAIADVFHAMLSSRVYHEPSPLYLVIKQMKDDVFGKFDPNIMLVFLYKLMESLTGKRVVLSDQREGSIMMIDPYEPLKALIRLDDQQLVDLRNHQDIHIIKVVED